MSNTSAVYDLISHLSSPKFQLGQVTNKPNKPLEQKDMRPAPDSLREIRSFYQKSIRRQQVETIA